MGSPHSLPADSTTGTDLTHAARQFGQLGYRLVCGVPGDRNPTCSGPYDTPFES